MRRITEPPTEPRPRSRGPGCGCVVVAGDPEPAREVVGLEHEAAGGQPAEDVQGEPRLKVARRTLIQDASDEQAAELHPGDAAAAPIEALPPGAPRLPRQSSPPSGEPRVARSRSTPVAVTS